jgi:hypothetical protein
MTNDFRAVRPRHQGLRPKITENALMGYPIG